MAYMVDNDDVNKLKSVRRTSTDNALIKHTKNSFRLSVSHLIDFDIFAMMLQNSRK